MAALVGLLTMLARPAGAQPSASASVDNTTVALDDTLTLTISVQGADQASAPDLPDIPGLSVISRGQSRSAVMSGGMTSVETAFQFTLRPVVQGTATIPSIAVRAGGQVLRTEPITIEVTAPRSGSAGGTAPTLPMPSIPSMTDEEEEEADDVFVSLEVDKQEAYVGEQIVLTFSLYYATRLRSVEYEPPGTEGFRTHPLPASPGRYDVVSGRRYVVKQEQKLLFPTAPGSHTVTPATVQYTTGFWEPAPRTLSTESIVIEVSRLPEAGKPESFSGVVGELGIRATVDQDTIKIGEAATLTAVVTGWGNLDAMEPPALELPSGLRQYQATEHREFEPRLVGDSYRMEGEALFDNVIIPTTVGDITVPPVMIGYFDPDARRYEVARSQSIVLHVQPGDGESLPTLMGTAQGTQLKPLPDRLVSRREGGLLSAPVIISQIVVVGWLLGVIGVYRRRAILAANPKLARSWAAARRAVARIRDARGLEPREAAAQIASAAAEFIGDKLDVSPAEVSAGSVVDLLGDSDVPADATADVASLLSTCDGVRFGLGEELNVSVLAEQAIAVVRALEKAIDRHTPAAREGGGA